MLITVATSHVAEPLVLVRLIVTASFVSLFLYAARPVEARGNGSRRVFNAYVFTAALIFGVGLVASMGTSLIWPRASAVTSFSAQLMLLRKPGEQTMDWGFVESWGVIVSRLRHTERFDVKSDLEELTLEIVETWRGMPRLHPDLNIYLQQLLRYAELEPVAADAILSTASAKSQSDTDMVFQTLLDSTANVAGRDSVSLEDLHAAFDRMCRLDANETVMPGQMRLLHIVESAS